MQSNRHNAIASKLRWLIVGVMVLSTLLFLTGIAIEQSGRESAAATSTQQTEPAPTDAGDPDGGHEGASTSSPGTTQAAAPAETVLGLDIEAPGFLAGFLLVWLVLALALFRWVRPALMALLLVAIATVVLDGAEIVHQTKEANTTLILLAAVVTLTHLIVAALAVLALLPKRGALATAARS